MRMSRTLAFSYPLLKVGQRAPATFLVDGTALMYKSYYAMPSMESVNQETMERTEVGAVAGFCSMLTNMMLPTPIGSDSTVLVMFDSKGPTFRHRLYDQYKAHRESAPEDLHPQFDIAYEALEAFGWPAIAAPGYEADDIIASMSRELLAADVPAPVVIVASDKDFMQCVDDNCFVICPTKKLAFTPRDVLEKFGVHPHQMSDYQALVGDSVDNIKGVPGIGPKTAAQLLSQFGSLASLIDNTDKIQNKRISKLVADNRESALLASSLVSLRDVPWDQLSRLSTGAEGGSVKNHILSSPTHFNNQAAHAFFDKYNMRAASRSLKSKQSGR